ncbi:MAG: hypothetical protein ACLUEV_03015 [Alistipes sp.]
MSRWSIRARSTTRFRRTTYQRNGIALNSRAFSGGKHAAELFGRPDGQSRRHEYQDDPDAQTGEWKKAHDNALRFNTSLDWLLNKS